MTLKLEEQWAHNQIYMYTMLVQCMLLSIYPF